MVLSLEIERLRLKLKRSRSELIYNIELLQVVPDKLTKTIIEIDDLTRLVSSKPKYYPSMESLVEDYVNSRENYAIK